MSKDWEDIEVNRKRNKKIVFESPLVQSIYDGIGYFKEETTEILREIDSKEFKQKINEVDVGKLGETAINHFEDFADDLSRLKDEVIDSDDVPDFVKGSSRDFKKALNKDEDYIRRARSKLDKLESDEMVDVERTNVRIIELCNKSIAINNKNHVPYYLKGIALTNLEDYDDAIEEFITSLALKDDVDTRLAIANANRLNGDFEDAINVYDSVIVLDPFKSLKGKAYTYYDWEKYDEASRAFKEASTLEALDDDDKKIWDECLEN